MIQSQSAFDLWLIRLNRFLNQQNHFASRFPHLFESIQDSLTMNAALHGAARATGTVAFAAPWVYRPAFALQRG